MRLADTEWRVMNVVWDRGFATARDVLDAVEDETDWAYSTVKTILSRLVEKGALSVRIEGNASVYAPFVTRDEAQRSELRSLAERAFGGTVVPLVHFLLSRESITDEERAELRRLLDETKSEGGL